MHLDHPMCQILDWATSLRRSRNIVTFRRVSKNLLVRNRLSMSFKTYERG